MNETSASAPAPADALPATDAGTPLAVDASRPAEATPRRRKTDDPIEGLRHLVLEKLKYVVGKDKNAASDRDWFIAVALAARDSIVNS